jgi:mono/diheme cytochrome c family protein
VRRFPDLRFTPAVITGAVLLAGAAGLLLQAGCLGTGAKSSAAPAGLVAPAPAESTRLSFNEHIQPILSENCYACHGPDSSTRKGKLRLDRFEFATAAREDHEPAIVPGRPAQSPLVERITAKDPDDRMPPLDSHKELKPAEIALLQRWVAEGARYEQHWSFIAPTRSPVPAAGRGWARNAIDPFIADALAGAGLQPNREEGAARLLRRVTLDLTGLPPTPAEQAAFARDPSPQAYERVVDRLLASDAAAEQSTRHWLDAVRYADTHGIHIDNYRSIWPYRDWVLGAFRRNLPFDQFTIEQMAGDLLPGATLDQKVASGFNRCLPTTSEGGAIPAEYEAIYAKDRVDTMSTVWLGLTTGCAACHDHKFDPVSTRDFYALTAFFRNNTMPAMDGNVADTAPNLFVPAVGDRARWTALQAERGALTDELCERSSAADAAFERWLATATTLAAPPADHTVRLHVPLNEPAGPIKVAGGGLAARSAGEPSRGAGLFGPAPQINDLDLVLGPPVPMTREGQVSFAMFVRVEGKPGGTVLSSLGADQPDHGWEIFLEDGKPAMSFSAGKDDSDVRAVAKDALAPGAWHHLMLVFDGTGSRNRLVNLFVDGRDVANAGVPRTLRQGITPAAPLRLGARHSADGRPAAGLKGGAVWVQDLRQYARLFSPAEIKELADVLTVSAALAVAPAERNAAQKKRLRTHYLATADAPSLRLAGRLDWLAAEEVVLRSRGGVTLVMEEKKDTEPFAHVLVRGEYSNLGEKVPAATPAVLPPLPAGGQRDRLALARWLVAPENPLTARVTVNRTWQHLFGTGLVESAGDFGSTGSRPSHPKLLDWLAVEFRESGWNYRHLVRLMVTSATYRQSAAVTPELLERDPANRLLTRGPRHRLDAEELRDQALAASGLLVSKLGGRPVRPYQPEGIWEDVAMKESTTRFYRQDIGENLYRRSLYTLWKRTAPPPAMDILNAPSREAACVRRDRTNTPLQALVTLNDPLFVEASRHVAARALRAAPAFEARLDAVAVRLLGRAFSAPERAVLRRTLDDALAVYRRDPAQARALLAVGESPVEADLPAPELAAWTLVASQVMNLDESLTK